MAEVYDIEDGYVADGTYTVYKTHELKNPLDLAIKEFEAVAMKFSLDFINDAKQRALYQQKISAISRQVYADVKAGKMSYSDGAAYCNEMRNQIMRETRLVTSPQGRAKAQKLKPDGGVPLEKILNKHSYDYLKKPYAELTKAERDMVHYGVIMSAGKPDEVTTAKTVRLRTYGRILIVVTAVLATYAILTAEDKQREAVIQGGTIGGGIGGGIIAGLGVPFLCGPGAPVCAIVVVLVGSAAGGLAVGSFTEKTYDQGFPKKDAFTMQEIEEMQEFSEWII